MFNQFSEKESWQEKVWDYAKWVIPVLVVVGIGLVARFIYHGLSQ
jgi:hypothetical protein